MGLGFRARGFYCAEGFVDFRDRASSRHPSEVFCAVICEAILEASVSPHEP